jgi:hypothetical protein
MGRLTKFWLLTRRDKKLFCEAITLLSLSNTCVKIVAFKHIYRFLCRHWNETAKGITCEQEVRLVQRSILRAANALPWKSLCLSRSIAEFIMLRRRGIPAVLFAGVRLSDRYSLDAHAWVDTGLGGHYKSSNNSAFSPLIRIGTGAVD